MKELKFKTSKGKFLIKEYDTFNDLVKDANFYKQKICKLSEITEEQASEIVDKKIGYKNYLESNDLISNYSCFTAIESLHSLLKSKGIHLFENPVPEPEIQGGYTPDGDFLGGYDDQWIADYEEAEEKTFYNPFIFKL